MAHRLAEDPTEADDSISRGLASGAARTTRMTRRPQDPTPERTLQPVAAILAWVLPGLGHWWIGQRKRAIRVFAGMAVLGLRSPIIWGVQSGGAKKGLLLA